MRIRVRRANTSLGGAGAPEGWERLAADGRKENEGWSGGGAGGAVKGGKKEGKTKSTTLSSGYERLSKTLRSVSSPQRCAREGGRGHVRACTYIPVSRKAHKNIKQIGGA